MSGKRVDIITTWAEAASALGISWRTLKAMHQDCRGGDTPMPIEVRGRRIITTASSLQEWVDQRAAMARQGKKN
jgi:hypothetical protein